MTEPIIDPVSGFEVPEDWLKRSNDPEVRGKVMSGKWVLLSDGSLLRRGFTTGTTAAAACKGAVISLAKPINEIEVPTPAGIRAKLQVSAKSGTCSARKDSGDHQFDVTKGIEILARAEASEEIKLIAGQGIGKFSRSGLCSEEGKKAISQSARAQIIQAIKEGQEESGLKGARVELSVPEGEKIALQTLNPELGISGGISILGSTGFVEPWNDHLGESRAEEIAGLEKVVVTTGRSGLKYSRMLFPDHSAVLLGNQLDRLKFREGQDCALCGLPALILKWAWPEVLEGSGYRTVAQMVEMSPDNPRIDKALEKARTKIPGARIVLLHKDGKVLRDVS